MKKLLLLPLLLLTLTACKIDFTIIGIGEVKTASDSIDCASGSTGDCQQLYVTDKTQCVGYEVGPPEVIPANCTLVTTSVNETFTALPGDNSNFGGWGNFCFDLADLSCRHTIAQVDAENQQQVDITATFDPEPTPQDATYTYNHLGQRASKTVAGVKTHFVYSDIDGQLLGEYTATGAPIREYIYLEGERVAMYDYTTVEPKDSSTQKAIVYLHNDHVGQVQFAFNSDGQMIYERIQTPFGETMGEMNVYNVQVPVRFPGQYYDSESGFNQNWHRDYDPALGRCVQSDPIGLRGGVNTFLYTMANPLMFIDPLGLKIYRDGSSYSDKPPGNQCAKWVAGVIEWVPCDCPDTDDPNDSADDKPPKPWTPYTPDHSPAPTAPPMQSIGTSSGAAKSPPKTEDCVTSIGEDVGGDMATTMLLWSAGVIYFPVYTVPATIVRAYEGYQAYGAIGNGARAVDCAISP